MASEPAKSQKYPRKAVPLFVEKDDSEEVLSRKFAKLSTSSELAASRIIEATERKSGIGDHIDVPILLETLRDQAAAANRGDLSQAEAILMNQATALQSLFSRLTERAMGAENIAPFEANLRMALRAQSQCRATLETLAAIKNPPVVYARQANVTTGPQQVNNNMTPSRAQEFEIAQNKQSGSNNELSPVSGTPALTSGTDSPMETLGEVHRAEVAEG